VYFGDAHPLEDVIGTSEMQKVPHQAVNWAFSDLRISFFKRKRRKRIRQLDPFTHMEGLALDPSGFSAPPSCIETTVGQFFTLIKKKPLV
jgi:hypothetical protein